LPSGTRTVWLRVCGERRSYSRAHAKMAGRNALPGSRTRILLWLSKTWPSQSSAPLKSLRSPRQGRAGSIFDLQITLCRTLFKHTFHSKTLQPNSRTQGLRDVLAEVSQNIPFQSSRLIDILTLSDPPSLKDDCFLLLDILFECARQKQKEPVDPDLLLLVSSSAQRVLLESRHKPLKANYLIKLVAIYADLGKKDVKLLDAVAINV